MVIFIFLLLCLAPTLFSNSIKQIVTEKAYPINGVCKAKHFNVSDPKTCLNLLETNSSFEISYYNSTSSECCLSNYQYIFATKKSENYDFTSFRIDINDTCPVVEKPWALETMNLAGNEKFVMAYNESTQIMNVTDPNCNGTVAIINGTSYCQIFVIDPWSGSHKTYIWQFSEKPFIASSPYDIHFTRLRFHKVLEFKNKTNGMIIMDGKRNANCQRADKIGLAEYKFPNGFDFVDKENPMLNSYTFVDQPSIATNKLCVSMFYSMTDSNMNMKVDYVRCDYYWEGNYTGEMSMGLLPKGSQWESAPGPQFDIQRDF
ncbi:unnamed protein product [Caenorhabditis angaria]|uniref:Uncharacterized protein n=1 Tax=Caenorhabditis angaria TaxID=860376 RepID=A0A9P1INZ0_9PELO|nr:unnamed protein product [Caenorhabditis angaria]